jgi:hypothetical protein
VHQALGQPSEPHQQPLEAAVSEPPSCNYLNPRSWLHLPSFKIELSPVNDAGQDVPIRPIFFRSYVGHRVIRVFKLRYFVFSARLDGHPPREARPRGASFSGRGTKRHGCYHSQLDRAGRDTKGASSLVCQCRNYPLRPKLNTSGNCSKQGRPSQASRGPKNQGRSVETDRLLEPTRDGMSKNQAKNDARLVIDVKIRPYQLTMGNIGFGT